MFMRAGFFVALTFFVSFLIFFSNSCQQKDIQSSVLGEPPVNLSAVSAILGKCLACHRDKPGTPQNDADLKEGLMRGVLPRMIRNAKGTQFEFTEPEVSELRTFIRAEVMQFIRSLPSEPAFSLVSESERQQYLELVPRGDPNDVGGAIWNALAGAAVFYSDKEMPRAEQERATAHYRVGAEKRADDPAFGLESFDPLGVTWTHFTNNNQWYSSSKQHHECANNEFPWDAAAGMNYVVADAQGKVSDDLRNIDLSEVNLLPSGDRAAELNRPSFTLKALVVPKEGILAEIALVNKPEYNRFAADNEDYNLVEWIYQPNTFLIEILFLNDPDGGKKIPFEVRIRRKMGRGGWQMDVLRPFRHPEELVARIKELVPNWSQDASTSRIIRTIESSPNLRILPISEFLSEKTLEQNSAATDALLDKALVEELPDMPSSLVRELLKTPFKSVISTPWRSNGAGQVGWSPMTKSRFSIVPRNYLGAFLPVNDRACMKCHETTLHTAAEFTQRDNIQHLKAGSYEPYTFSREWYDQIRGSDGIFSLHPFDPEEAVSYRGPYSGKSIKLRGTMAPFFRGAEKIPHEYHHWLKAKVK